MRYARYSGLLVCWIWESLSFWPSLSLLGFFQSVKRAPLSSLAASLCPSRRAWFHTSRRISSSASVASLMTWNGSTHRIASEHRSVTEVGGGPPLAADLVQRDCRELDDVEWVHAPDHVRAPVADCGGDRLRHVTGHQLELSAAFFSEHVQELLDRLAVAAGGGPHQLPGVVVDDHGQIPVAFSI